jgi:hypothetical protein
MGALLSLIDRPILFIGTAIISFPLYIKIGQLFFDGWDDFLDTLRFIYQPQWLSALRGEWHEDNWGSVKFLFFLICCAAAATTVYKIAKLIF